MWSLVQTLILTLQALRLRPTAAEAVLRMSPSKRRVVWIDIEHVARHWGSATPSGTRPSVQSIATFQMDRWLESNCPRVTWSIWPWGAAWTLDCSRGTGGLMKRVWLLWSWHTDTDLNALHGSCGHAPPPSANMRQSSTESLPRSAWIQETSLHMWIFAAASRD